MKHVVQFSGGLGSFWAAHRIITQHGRENVTLVFADVIMEDEDLYRFLVEAVGLLYGVDTSALARTFIPPLTQLPERKRVLDELFFRLPQLVRLCDGRTPWELFGEEGVIGRSGIALCSKKLKRDLSDKWRVSNTSPEDSCFYLGIDWTEEHRMLGNAQSSGMVNRFKPWSVAAPMMAKPLWDKCRMRAEAEKIGLRVPRLYDLGFPHNNCGGFCIKAGHAHFAHLLRTMPERYAYHEKREEDLRAILGDYSVMKDRRGGVTKSLPMKALREMIELGARDYDTEDWGGCGCSVELSASKE